MVNILMCDIIRWKLYLLDFSFQHFIVSLLVYFHSQGVDFFGFFLRFSLNPLDLILRLFFQSCNGVMELLNLTTQVRGLFQWPWWTVRIRDCCFGRIFVIVWWHLKIKKDQKLGKKWRPSKSRFVLLWSNRSERPSYLFLDAIMHFLLIDNDYYKKKVAVY